MGGTNLLIELQRVVMVRSLKPLISSLAISDLASLKLQRLPGQDRVLIAVR